MADVDLARTLDHVIALERELHELKLDLLRALPPRPSSNVPLYGALRGGDVSDDMIGEAKRSLSGKDVEV